MSRFTNYNQAKNWRKTKAKENMAKDPFAYGQGKIKPGNTTT